MTQARCPICQKPSKPRSENEAFPFCSARCKQVDLGKWVNEEYRVPAEDDDDDPDAPPDGGRGSLH